MDVVEIKHKHSRREKRRDVPRRGFRPLLRRRGPEPLLHRLFLDLLLPLEDFPLILERDVLEARDGLVVQHGGIEDLVEASFRVSDDEDEDLVDQFGEMGLELGRGLYEARIFLEVMEEESGVGYPKG